MKATSFHVPFQSRNEIVGIENVAMQNRELGRLTSAQRVSTVLVKIAFQVFDPCGFSWDIDLILSRLKSSLLSKISILAKLLACGKVMLCPLLYSVPHYFYHSW